jgi:hypothetical protein
MAETAEAPVPRPKDEIIREAKRIYEDVLYSSKSHFVAARIWSNVHLSVGLAAVLTTALAAGLVSSDPITHKSLATWLFVASAIFSAGLTFLNPNERAGAHLNCGNHYDALRNRIRIFWSVQCWLGDIDLAALAAQLQGLSGDKDRLNLSSPQPPGWAYAIARKQIEAGQASFEVDKT